MSQKSASDLDQIVMHQAGNVPQAYGSVFRPRQDAAFRLRVKMLARIIRGALTDVA
jgi:hypothetical protein